METAAQLPNELMKTIKRIEKKVDFIEDEIITIKSWLNDDSKLSPYEKKLVDETIKKVKSDDYMDLTSLEELKKTVGI